MKSNDLLNHMYKRTWTGKTTMTDQSLGLVILAAAVAGAATTILAKRCIKRIIMKISTPKASEVNNDIPPEFHETVCSAEFPEGCIDS